MNVSTAYKLVSVLIATFLYTVSTPRNILPPRKRAENLRVNIEIMEGGEKKRDLLDKIADTERKIESYEREISNLIYERRHEFRSVFCTLEEADAKLLAQRKRDKHELRKQVDKTRLSVDAFKRLLAEMKPGSVCVEKLKITMEEIEGAITAFKEKQRETYEELLQEERIVTLEINALEKKLDNWSSSQPTSIQPTHPRQTAAQVTSLHPAVLAFDAFVERTGGHRGGWDDYDHQTFVRVRTRHSDKVGFIEAAVSELPTRSRDEIEAHEQWVQEYTKLNEAKKAAINEWKQQKKDSNNKGDEMGPGLNVEEVHSQRAEILAKEREDRLAQLAVWKVQQQAKREEAEKLKQEQELERLKEIEKARERQAAVKAKAQQYIARKVQEKQVLELQEEARQNEERARRMEATKEAKKFRERDTKTISKKQQRQKFLELEAMEKERRLQKLKEEVKITAERDPTRLLKLTAGWEERKKAGVGSGIAAGAAVLAMPRRAIPSWRQGI